MALTKLTANVANIIGLDDNPNEGATPLSSTELKNTFDKAGTDIKNYINNTLTEELDTKLTTTSSDIGTLTNLETTTKSDIVSAINELYEIVDSGYYKAGDSITASFQIAGYVTTSRTQMMCTIYLPKSLKNITSITVAGGTFSIRTTNGAYLNGGDFAYNASGITTEAFKNTDNAVTIRITKSSAFSNVNNNTPVGGALSSLKLNFS